MVKRYESHLKEVRGEDPTATMLEWVNGDWVEFGDYDALGAELAELRQHLGTLTPGGSHTCITCAAHVKVITEDLEPRIKELEADLAFQKDLLAKYHALNCQSETIAKQGENNENS